jgi:hypothetical protein
MMPLQSGLAILMEIMLAQAKSRDETPETMPLATTYTLMVTHVILASGSDSRLLRIEPL